MNIDRIIHRTIGSEEPEPNISARIICDSQFRATRLTTFILKYPRFIHCELMTHRALSKNSASSRAIPLKKMLAMVEEAPAVPEYWAAEKPGMQGGDHLNQEDTSTAFCHWFEARRHACDLARRIGIKAHKSIANRVLEPFAHMTVVCTGESRGLAQFFSLRAHPMAQPEFQVLAYRMLDQYMQVIPDRLEDGQWHRPFYDHREMHSMPFDEVLKICTARCARVSYLTHEGKRDAAKDLELHDRLLSQDLPHASPFEHCAQANEKRLSDTKTGNFGHFWMQYRKTLPKEFIWPSEFDAEAIMARKPSWIQL